MANPLEKRLQASLESRLARSILRRVDPPSSHLIDFSSNDYLSLASNTSLRELFLRKLAESEHVLGSGGSRLLDGNTPAHYALETRLREFFGAPAALLFNSGFDANVALFTTLPQPGDVIILDELIHASVWDGCRASRAKYSIRTFKHNSMKDLEKLLVASIQDSQAIRLGESNVFLAVESLYSMDGDFAPLLEIVELVERLLPKKNGYIVVDEAHATGLYGPQGRGLTAALGLEDRIPIRLHTFGKALASNGAVVLASPIIRSYLCNYARSLIFTTAMGYSNVVSIGCSFDMLENDRAYQLSLRLSELCSYFFATIVPQLSKVPPTLASLPVSAITAQNIRFSPIIPLLTSKPRDLAAHLQRNGYLARPITWPTVPKSHDRVRICIHAGNTKEELDGLITNIISWASSQTPSAKL